jgi:hypothetical protein
VQKSAQACEKKELGWRAEWGVALRLRSGWTSGPSASLGVNSFQNGKDRPPPPMFFVSADSKEVAGEMLVSADSAGLKVAVFSVSWEGLVSADFKGVAGAFVILISKQIGSADSSRKGRAKAQSSKGVRRTAWRGRMVRRARKDRAESTKPL